MKVSAWDEGKFLEVVMRKVRIFPEHLAVKMVKFHVKFSTMKKIK